MSDLKPVDYQKYKKLIPDFYNTARSFFEGDMNLKEYKGYSGKYGTYSQRGGKKSMLRLRMNAGRLTPEKLKMVSDMAERCEVDPIHFTTGQTVQFHNLELDDLCQIMEKVLDAGIVWYGGGGDYPRNVMASPLSGTEEEYFDVMPYAEKAAQFLLDFIDQDKMPRKLKVGFSNSESNKTHATFRDLGFVATPKGTFDVYCCGGLGKDPRLGVCVAEDVEPDQILYYIEAMILFFRRFGNYENRAKARTRFIQEKLSADEIRREFSSILEELQASKDLRLDEMDLRPVSKKGDGTVLEESFLVQAQKQPGLYRVAFHPRGGNISRKTLKKLSDAVGSMQDVEIRLSPDEGCYIINLSGSEAEKILEIIDPEAARTPFETSTSCIGAAICQVGVRDSQSVLQKTLEAVRHDEKIAWNALPQIHISGCPSSCAAHQTAPIGLRGGVKVIDRRPVAAFALYAGGDERQGHETFGREIGMIAEADVPEFFRALGQKVTESGLGYEEWAAANPQGLEEAAQPFLL